MQNEYVFLLNVFLFSAVPVAEVTNKSEVRHERAESIQCIRKKEVRKILQKKLLLLKVATFQRLFQFWTIFKVMNEMMSTKLQNYVMSFHLISIIHGLNPIPTA